MKAPGPSEDQLHIAVAEFLDWILKPPAMYSTFPAGRGKFGFKLQKLLKRCGLKPGMPDIFVFPGGGRAFGIELKIPGNYLTPVQHTAHSLLDAAGIRCYVARSVEAVIEVLEIEQVPMRPTGGQRWLQPDRKLPLDATYAGRADGGAGRGGDDGAQRTTTGTEDGAGPGIA